MGKDLLAASDSRAGTAWTEHRTARRERGLKHRAEHEPRTLPIPPELVKLLHDALGVQDIQPESEPGDEGDDDSGQAS